MPPPANPCQASGSPGQALFPIVNGTACDATTSSVVMLRIRRAGTTAVALCSGTVIGARAVLTAAHCVVGNPTEIGIERSGAPEIVARSSAVHPDYHAALFPIDVAIVTTEADLGRRPIPLLVSRDGRVGETAIIAGFGKDANGVLAILRAGVATVYAVSETSITTNFTGTGSGTCGGDSGGPLLLSQNGEWALGAVTSGSINADLCRSGVNSFVAVRAASVSSFIRDLVSDALLR